MLETHKTPILAMAARHDLRLIGLGALLAVGVPGLPATWLVRGPDALPGRRPVIPMIVSANT